MLVACCGDVENAADDSQWDIGAVRGLGWSEDEKLLVVTEDGTVRVYHDLQADFVPFTLGHVC
jgi:hypothetical protein